MEHLLDGVRAICLALPGVTEAPTHGAPTWFVRRRSFAKYVDPAEHRFDEPHVALWAAAPPGARVELVAADPETFFAPPFGGRNWVAMRLDRHRDPPWDEVREVLLDAYRQTAPRTLIVRLEAQA